MNKITGRMMNCGGFPIFIPNDITNKQDDFYISFNTVDKHIYGDITTALVHEFPKGEIEKFYILNGNHVEQYNKIINDGGGIKECLEYFKSNENLISKYSERIKENDS